MRAEEHHLAARGELLDEATHDQRRTYVEPGKRLIQQDEIGVCSRAAERRIFWRMPLEYDEIGTCRSPWSENKRRRPSIRSAVGFAGRPRNCPTMTRYSRPLRCGYK